MEKKTEELRDLFLDVTDEKTVTESQEEGRGSLTDDGRPVDERLESAIETMQSKFSFETDWSDDEYCQAVKHFYDGTDDAELAADLDHSPTQVFQARMDLHLLRDDDPMAAGVGESELAAVRDRREDTDETLAESLGVDEEAVARCRAVLAARDRSRRTSHRFQTEFEEILTDADLTVQYAEEAHDDGLDDATEGAEVDVDF